MADLPVGERPRERLLRLGAAALSDTELVAILLGAGRPGVNVLALAQAMLVDFGGIGALLRLSAADLTSVAGVGPATAARFLSAAELCRRSAADCAPSSKLRSSADLATAAVKQLANLPDERLLMVGITSDHLLRNAVVLAQGGEGQARCPVSNVLRAVLAGGCSKFALIHNHPSGVLDPSHADVAYTEHVSAAALQCGLQLIDHLVVAGSRWKSIV